MQNSEFKDDVQNGGTYITCLWNEHLVKMANLSKLFYWFNKIKIRIQGFFMCRN